ncbi:MAG: alpha/beta hydrolase [Gammaproteobacteria bacterium]
MAVSLFYAGMVLVIFAYQGQLLYLPSREWVATPHDIDLPYEDVTLATDDGYRLHGWYLPADDKELTVLFFHGNAGNVSHRLDTLRLFHGLGLDTFIIDYRGYGRSEGSPSEAGTYLDAQAAWKYLVDTRGIHPENIILFGRSLGAAVATWLAARRTPAALIVESGFTSVPDLAAKLYPFLPVRLLARYQYDSRQSITHIRSPVLVIHSVEDEIIPFTHGRALFEAAPEPKQLLPIQGSHNEGFLVSKARYLTGLASFLETLDQER